MDSTVYCSFGPYAAGSAATHRWSSIGSASTIFIQTTLQSPAEERTPLWEPQPPSHIIATTPSQCSRRCATGPDHCNTTQRVNARRVTRRHARARELRLHHQQAKDVTIHCVHPRITTYKVHTASQSRIWAPQSGHRILGTAIWPPRSLDRTTAQRSPFSFITLFFCTFLAQVRTPLKPLAGRGEPHRDRASSR